VAQHAELTERLARLSLDRAAARLRLETAREAAAAVATLTERAGRARTLADAVDAAQAASVLAVGQRTELRNEVDARAAAIAELDASVQRAVAQQAQMCTASDAAAAAAGAARAATERSETRVQTARLACEAIARRDEATRLAGRVTKIDATRTEQRDCAATLAAITVSAAAMKAIETASSAVERAGMQAELAAARVEVTALTDVAVTIAGEPVELAAGAVHSVVAGAATDVDLPGVLTVRVVPGEPAADSQALFDAARQHLGSLLNDAHVADVAAARALDERRRELTADRDRLKATCDALLGDDDVETLRARLAALRAEELADHTCDADAARVELEAAVAAHREAVGHADAMRAAAEQAAAAAAEQTTLATALSQKVASARTELAVAADKLAQQRESVTDDQLAATANADAERARVAVADAQAVAAELAGLAPAAVAAELEEAGRAAETLDQRHERVGEHLRDVAAQLKVYGSEGRKGRLDAAEAERQHAHTEHARLQRRAGAAELLRSVMGRHRDAARLRYVDPFRREVERLGRIVFGDDFEVDIDGELRIRSRTLAGITVAYDSLSGGAKEQLGIVARLAGSALVAKEDGVPVVIDDALGFTDAVRLTRMGEVFDAVGGDGQVIVLTCSPERYAAVGDARHVELSA
jgi:hypothetical protein